MKNVLALSAAAVAPLSTPIARADIITLHVSGTLTPDTSTGAACSPTCTLGGDIVIDNSAGADNGGFVSADVTAKGFSPSVGPFTQLVDIDENTGPGGNTILTLGDPIFMKYTTFTPGSFFNYTGGPVESITLNFRHIVWNGSGSFTIPEPSTWAMMALGFAGLGFAGYRSHRRSVSIAA